MADVFATLGMLIGAIRFLSAGEAFSLSDKDVVFIDLRPDYEIAGKKIRVKTIVYINWKDFEEQYQILDPEKSFIVFDEVGLHSKDIVKFLQEHGCKHVASMIGGIFDWERAGLPMSIDKGELLTGSCACTLKPKKNFKSHYDN